jgi:ubiquinone/menaquinone biosynthesis C-methylase UbiE
MNTWHSYYSQLKVGEYLANLFGQRYFLERIDSEGQSLLILEVGTGTGSMSVFLSQRGHKLTAIDNDPEVLALAQVHADKFGGKALTFLEADAFALPFPDQSFDVVFHQGLLEHFNDSDIRAMLTEQLRVARKVIFSVPNHLYPRRDFGNERLMTLAQWDKVLAGFKIIEAASYSLKWLPRPFIVRAKIQHLFVIEK